MAGATDVENKSEINYEKKLPDAEFDVMKAIWEGTPPVNTAYLMEKVGRDRGWKASTLISFLVRLEDRGYITSEKRGKERYYTPVAEQNRYMQSVTEQFVHLMNTLYRDKSLSEGDIDELLEWLKTKY